MSGHQNSQGVSVSGGNIPSGLSNSIASSYAPNNISISDEVYVPNMFHPSISKQVGLTRKEGCNSCIELKTAVARCEETIVGLVDTMKSLVEEATEILETFPNAETFFRHGRMYEEDLFPKFHTESEEEPTVRGVGAVLKSVFV